MTAPTVGRIVHYWDSRSIARGQPLAGIIAFVHSPDSVTLGLTTHTGGNRHAMHVPLVQPRAPKPDGAFCEWPPRVETPPPQQASAEPAQTPRPTFRTFPSTKDL